MEDTATQEQVNGAERQAIDDGILRAHAIASEARTAAQYIAAEVRRSMQAELSDRTPGNGAYRSRTSFKNLEDRATFIDLMISAFLADIEGLDRLS